MKRFVLSAIALEALASTAVAQQPPAPPLAPASAASDFVATPPPDGPEATHAGDRAGPPPRGPDNDMAFRGHRPPPPPASKAAHFRIQDGDTKIDIKCADDEPMKACSDTLLQLMDRIEGQPL